MEKNSAKRSLFGRSKLLASELESSKQGILTLVILLLAVCLHIKLGELAKAAEKWNFDFKREQPLPKSSSDMFEWEGVSSEQLPPFYQAKQTSHPTTRLQQLQSATHQSHRTKSAQPAKPKKIRSTPKSNIRQSCIKNYVVIKRRANISCVKVTSPTKIEDGRVYFKTRSMSTMQTRSKLHVIDYRS